MLAHMSDDSLPDDNFCLEALNPISTNSFATTVESCIYLLVTEWNRVYI